MLQLYTKRCEVLVNLAATPARQSAHGNSKPFAEGNERPEHPLQM